MRKSSESVSKFSTEAKDEVVANIAVAIHETLDIANSKIGQLAKKAVPRIVVALPQFSHPAETLSAMLRRINAKKADKLLATLQADCPAHYTYWQKVKIGDRYSLIGAPPNFSPFEFKGRSEFFSIVVSKDGWISFRSTLEDSLVRAWFNENSSPKKAGELS